MGIARPSGSPPPSGGTGPVSPSATARKPKSVTLRAVLAHQWCDQATEALIYFAIVFSPWAFGTSQFWSGYNTSQFWSTQVMNATGYALGALLLVKWLIRWRHGYRPARWDDVGPDFSGVRRVLPRVLTMGLAVVTAALLGYCLVSALNARADYFPARMEFVYRTHVPWLPHSYDGQRTLQGFYNYAALAGAFWALRDWLLGKSAGEIRAERTEAYLRRPASALPGRLRRLLWVISVNGALLGVEGIVQRLDGTGKLLWLVQPRINQTADLQFGPYAYRANAAQYFNLVWPLTLGFWWTLWREARRYRAAGGLATRHWPHVLLPCVVIMAACPLVSLSRGGAFVAFANMILAVALLFFGLRRRHPLVRFGVLLFFGATLALGLTLSWDLLSERLKDTGAGFEGREATNQTARKMAEDYPWFGTGPGTFDPVFQLYRESPEEYWPAQLHNDWLETRITFGRVGSGLIGLAFALALARGFLPGGIQAGWRLTSLLWLSLAGCLVHARFDFPLQIYSLLLLFLIVCAILSCVGRRQNTAGPGAT